MISYLLYHYQSIHCFNLKTILLILRLNYIVKHSISNLPIPGRWTSKVSKFCKNLHAILSNIQIPGQQNSGFLAQLTVCRRSGVGCFTRIRFPNISLSSKHNSSSVVGTLKTKMIMGIIFLGGYRIKFFQYVGIILHVMIDFMIPCCTDSVYHLINQHQLHEQLRNYQHIHQNTFIDNTHVNLHDT